MTDPSEVAQSPAQPYSAIQSELEQTRSKVDHLDREVTTLKSNIMEIQNDVKSILHLLRSLPNSPALTPSTSPPTSPPSSERHKLTSSASYQYHHHHNPGMCQSGKSRRDSISSVPGLHSGTSLVGILKMGPGDRSPPGPLSPATGSNKVDFVEQHSASLDNSPPGLLDTSHCSGGSGGSDSGVFRTSGASSKSDPEVDREVPDCPTYMDHYHRREGDDLETEALLGDASGHNVDNNSMRRQQIPSDADSGNESPRAWLSRLTSSSVPNTLVDSRRHHPHTGPGGNLPMNNLTDCTSSRSTLESLLADNDSAGGSTTGSLANSLPGSSTNGSYLCTDL